MDDQIRAHISALTGGFVELLGILAQRGAINKGDVGGVFAIMQHALRHPGNEEALRQLSVWFDRTVEFAQDSIPLPRD